MRGKALEFFLLAAIAAPVSGQDLSADGQKHLDQGLEAARQKDWKLAAAYFTKAQECDPRSPAVIFNLGLAHSKAGNELLAIVWLHVYLTVHPQAPNAGGVTAEIAKLKWRLREKTGKIFKSAAAEAERLQGQERDSALSMVVHYQACSGDLEGAVDLGNSLKTVPDGLSLIRLHAVEMAKAADLEGALETANKLDPREREEVRSEAAKALIRLNKYSEAERIVMEMKQGKSEVLKEILKFRIAEGNFVPVETHIDSLDESARNEVGLAWVLKYLDKGDVSSAARQARAMIEKSDYDVQYKGRAFMSIALEQLAKGDAKAAKETSRDILGLGDRTIARSSEGDLNNECLVVASAILGNVEGAYALAGRVKRAIADSKPWHYRQIAYVLALLGNTAGAEEASDRARKAAGKEYAGEGEAAIALALLCKGDIDRATAYAERTRYNLPSYLQLQIVKARVKSGDLKGAESAARKMDVEPKDSGWDPKYARPLLAEQKIEAYLALAAGHGKKPEAVTILADASRLCVDPTWLKDESWLALMGRVADAQAKAGDDAGSLATRHKFPSTELREWIRLASKFAEDKAVIDLEGWLRQHVEGAAPREFPNRVAYAGFHIGHLLHEVNGAERRANRVIAVRPAVKEATTEVAAEISRTVERKVTTLPLDARLESFSSQNFSQSPDGRRWALKTSDDQKQYVLLDGVKGEPFDSVVEFHLNGGKAVLFSPDGSRAAYFGKRGDKIIPVVNGQRLEECDEIVQSFKFSSDGKRWALVVRRKDKTYAIVDGAASEPFQSVSQEISFSPDSRRVAYAVWNGKQTIPMVDGRAGEPMDADHKIVFSPDGKRFAYIARGTNARYVVVDGQRERPYPFLTSVGFTPDNRLRYLVREQPPAVPMINGKMLKDVAPFTQVAEMGTILSVVFDQDRKRFACLMKRDDAFFVFADGKKQDGYDAIYDLRFVGPRLVYVGMKGQSRFLICDGVASRAWDSFGYLVPAPVTNQIAFIGKLGEKTIAAIEGDPVPNTGNVSSIRWSADGKQLYLVIKKDSKYFAVVNGVKSEEFDSISIRHIGDQKQIFTVWQNKKYFTVIDGVKGEEYDSIGSLVVAPGGKSVAFDAKLGKEAFVVVDGSRGDVFDSISHLQFSREGKLAFIGTKSNKKQVLVVDGFRTEEYDQIHWAMFLENGALRYQIKNGSQWQLVENNKKTLLWDSAKGPEFTSIAPVTTRDGSRTAFYGNHKERYSLVVDGVEQKSDLAGISGLEFSPDGKDLYYSITPNLRWSVKMEGSPDRDVTSSILDRGYHVEKSIRLNPAGTKVAYYILDDKKRPHETRIVSQGKVLVTHLVEPSESSSVPELFFTPDGEKVVSVVSGTRRGDDGLQQATMRMFVDQGPVAISRSFDNFRFDPSGTHWAFTGYTDKFKKAVWTSLGRQESYEQVSELSLSPDGKHVAYIGQNPTFDFSVILDGKTVATFPEIGAVGFTPDGKFLTYGARKGREIWWKVVPLQ